MKEIAYTSLPLGLVFDDDVLSIVRVSRDYNSRAGITGYLAYDGEAFLQVIEGPDAAVDSLYDRILDDPRHHQIVLLADGPVRTRAFADWAMGYRRVKSVIDEVGPASGAESFAQRLSVLLKA